MFCKVREVPQSEMTPFHPRSSYGISKVVGFQLILLCHNLVSLAVAPMIAEAAKQMVRQNDHEFPFYGGNRIWTMSLRPEGRIPSAANPRELEVA